MQAREEDVELRDRRLGWAVWCWWVLATLVGGLVLHVVAWGMDKPQAGGIVEWAVAGSAIGLVQWLVLRRSLSGLAWWAWVAATALGLGLGVIVAGIITVPASTTMDPISISAITGA